MNRPLVVAVQEQRRLFRDCITATLRDQLDSATVLEGVQDGAELRALAAKTALSHVVLEADRVPWDVQALVSELCALQDDLVIIGLGSTARRSRIPAVRHLARSATPEEIAGIIQPGAARPVPFLLTARESAPAGTMTTQQLHILALMSLGVATQGISARLGISERAVARAKEVLYEKLGAQSQAQAVAAALSSGYLGLAAVTPAP